MPANERKVHVSALTWIAVALLHREHPDKDEFTEDEIVARAEAEEGLGPARLRPELRVYVSEHCVANKKPSPGRYRMLFETQPGRRRLYRPGDPIHPEREFGKHIPPVEALPDNYRMLIDWYRKEYATKRRAAKVEDLILSLRGLGKGIWAGENPDVYVRKLREARE